jgi:CRP-like cAMP-binding protein
MRSLERAQTLTMLLRHNSAKERVSAFLLDMADRTSRRDNFKFRHMDIADYLGLSRETVSRVLAQLATKRIDRRGQGSARAEASAVAVRTESVAVPL